MGIHGLDAHFIARFAISPTCAGTAVRALHMQHGAIKKRLAELVWKRKSSPAFGEYVKYTSSLCTEHVRRTDSVGLLEGWAGRAKNLHGQMVRGFRRWISNVFFCLSFFIWLIEKVCSLESLRASVLSCLSLVMRAHCFMLKWTVLFIWREMGFGLASASASALDSISQEAELEASLLLPSDGQTASLFELDRFPGDFLSEGEGEGEEIAGRETSLWEDSSSSVPFEDESALFSHPLPPSSLDESSGSNDFLFSDIASGCATSESFLPLPLSGAIDRKSRARRRRRGSSDSKSCDNPQLPPANTFPMTTNSHPPSSDDTDNNSNDDDKNDPFLPLVGGAGSALLGVAFFSECAAVTTYALPVIYCNVGTKNDVRNTGKRDFQFRGKFDTWSLVKYQTGLSISIAITAH